MYEESKKTLNEATKLEFEKSLQLRNFEIDNFWKRGWFFGALLLAIITGYITLAGKEDAELNSWCIYLSFIGLIVSVIQSLMNRGSKYWQERYEYKTKSLESKLGIDVTKISRFNDEERSYIDGCIINKNTDNMLNRAYRFSVSKLTFLVWDILAIAWLFIWINDTNIFSENRGGVRLGAILFHLVVIAYICIFYSKGSVHESLDRTKSLSQNSSDYINNNIGVTK